MSQPLSAAARGDALARLGAEELDVLVVGGGVVGTGTALDAATRGLSVGLVEAEDWASGTSSRSSKLIHGGLRYLEMLDFALVHEALRERALMLADLAPHLVHPVPFLYPLTHRGWERPYVGAGVALYDTMGHTSGRKAPLARHRHLSKRRTLSRAPSLRTDEIVGAIQYWDGQVDDARHTMTLARTAAHYGVACASRTRLSGLLREGERVVGATVVDTETGSTIGVRARHVISAAGVWTGDTAGEASVKVLASKGVHIVLRGDAIDSDSALILRTEHSVLLVIPWWGQWLVGTTDTPWDLDRGHPVPSADDVDYLLEHLNRVLGHPVGRESIVGVYAGLRPLVDTSLQPEGAVDTAKLSREHVVVHPEAGLSAVVGGKYTTYRVMAEDAVDAAVQTAGWRSVPASATATTPLVGADGLDAVRNQRARLAARAGVSPDRVEHLLGRYGSLVTEVLGLVNDDADLARPLPGASAYCGAEVVYAATHEGAMHLDDVLVRRTRIAFEVPDFGLETAPEAARLLGRALGWNQDRTDAEMTTYRRWAEGQQAALREHTDKGALAAAEGVMAGDGSEERPVTD